MRYIKRRTGADDVLRRNVLIVIEMAVLLTLIIIVVAVLKSDLLPLQEEPTLYVTTQNHIEESSNYEADLTLYQGKNDETNIKENEETHIVGDKPISKLENYTENNLLEPSNWSRAEIVAKAKEAVNKTKAYNGSLTVNHSETFSANVTECSAGGIIRTVVELMIGWVVKPVQETLVYQNGRAVNSEGETVPIILPKKNSFSLTEKGVKSASVQSAGNEYIIRLEIVEESVGMYDVPMHNAASVGYLDVSKFDLSFMEVDSASIVYKGSSVEFRINAEGFVTYAKYRIPLHIDGSAHKGSISGSATFEGEQSEEWILNY